ncbi:MAG: translation initiation factor IF-2 [Catonella sp.]|uniref:translation initiation factor IF-2 n=1 Tax=Catonella sp. TaxID=2382125 RepID=UPI003F9F5599
MSKMKVSELAVEIKLKSKEIVDFLHEKGYDNVKNMNSVLSDEEETTVRMQYAPESIKKAKPEPKAEAKPKRTKPAAATKPMKQTFDGRSPEVREAVERKAKKISAEKESRKTLQKDEEVAVKETKRREEKTEKEIKVKEVKNSEIKNSEAIVSEASASEVKVTEDKNTDVKTSEVKQVPEKPEMTPEEAAIAFARKKASQAAALNNDKAAKNTGSGNKSQKFGDKKRNDRFQGQKDQKDHSKDGNRENRSRQGDGQNKNNENFRGNRNSDRPQGQKNDRPFNKDGSNERRQPSGNNHGGNTGGRTAQARGGQTRTQNASGGEERIITKTGSRDREREREREKAKERERSEKNLSKRFDKNKVLSNIDDDENVTHRKKKDPNRKGAFIKPEVVVKPAEEDTIKNIIIPDTLTIKELADKMKIQPSAIIKKLFLQGKMYTVTQDISFEEAEEIALEYNIICELEEPVDLVAELLKEDEEDEALMVKRPPVVCVMGHVDHGKTSLLDAIRSTNVTSREAGGITQSIGASVVTINGNKITFLDTPGHEAFTAMRMRGAKSTDIAILVVAADDGVMPQTVEAINHAKAAGVEIIVAINKIDKPSANIDKVKQELTEHELIAEDWGGSTVFVPVSAHSKEGIPTLLEMVILTADVADYKANPNRDARGIVIEASLDKGRGPVATVLVQKGTLHVGDSISIGSSFGKVRAMIDDKGNNVTEAGPSIPVEILGLNGVPNSGDTMLSFKDDKEARAAAETFIAQDKARLIDESRKKLSLDGLFDQIKAGTVKELNVIIKADVQGSVEAIKQSITKLNNDEVAIRVIHGAVGAINESDISLASASNAIVIGFNVRMDAVAKETADREKVDVRLYKIIYDIISDVESAMKGMLEPIYEEKVIGHAEIRQVFKASGIGNIAGSFVLDGKIIRGCKVRITRDKDLIFEGNLASLKRFKDDVKEVNAGYECGLVFEKFNDVKEEDKVELYQMVEVPRS